MMGRGSSQMVSAVLVYVVVADNDCNGGDVVKGRAEGGEGAGNASPLHFQQDLAVWGSSRPPLTASHIHIGYLKSV
jgi:hypothetical protein